jgi:hypothetical protein
MSLAGTARTLVAVGTSKLSSMFVTTRADVPLSFSVTVSGTVTAVVGAGSGVSREVIALLGVVAGCTVALVTGATVDAGADVGAGGIAGDGVGNTGGVARTGGTGALVCGTEEVVVGAVLLGFTGESSLGW